MTVKAASVTATGTLVSTPGRLLGLWVRAGATAGTVVLKDGGASGTTRFPINTPAAVGGHFIPIAGGGILFETDIHATLAVADAVTAIYQEGG